jgi:hypothetical protein
LENRILMDLSGAGRPYPVHIRALSPSDGSVKLALKEIASLLPKQGQPQRSITPRSPNHTSIVLWVEAGPLKALLGADLEHTGNQGEGWMAVLDCHHGRPVKLSANFFKVPHHGSKNADNPDVWQHMLDRNPIAVVTPYNGGGTPLPRQTDLERLKQRTNQLYCTSQGPGPEPRRDTQVERTMKQLTKTRRVFGGRPGHVRVRWLPDGSPPKVEKFEGAYQP